MTSDIDKIFNEQLNTPSVFLDETRIQTHYLPDRLLFRDNQLRIILQQFTGLINHKDISNKLLITGPIGSGKTILVKKVGLWLEKNKDIKYVYVDCRRSKTTHSILVTIARSYDPSISSRGRSSSDLMDKIIQDSIFDNRPLFLVLDNIDMMKASVEVLEMIISSLDNFTAIKNLDGFDKKKPSIGLCMTSNTVSYINEIKHLASIMALRLEYYSYFQIVEILKERSKEVFNENTVLYDTIKLIADLSHKSGNLSYALDLLYKAGKYADHIPMDIIYPECVLASRPTFDPRSLSRHKLITLYAIMHKLHINKRDEVSNGDVIDYYNIICLLLKITKRKTIDIWEYILYFRKIGIIFIRSSYSKTRGDEQLISLTDYVGKGLREEISEILGVKK